MERVTRMKGMERMMARKKDREFSENDSARFRDGSCGGRFVRRKIRADLAAGRLDSLISEALEQERNGETRPL